ncbi:tetratricopeptide repeat protein [uncultured Roseibium sp.]|uniref:winged helix-turn-helix domain-containing tetratricopeptide repeat protein n=1 Tax=uncultured Roseibium sp. TaxID=1936171 RepID=UPI0026172842|nr:tetratricopeptide repeat protein [uncultured Roseibium sp.]
MEECTLSQNKTQIWNFRSFTLNEASFELTCSGVPVAIEPQSLRVLIFLIRHRDRVVSKDDLVEVIWQGRAISDWAISGAIKAVRIALGDTVRNDRIIKTIHGRGFRFVADAISKSPETVSVPKPTVLVRAFRSNGADTSLDYLADGLTEDLIHTLSRHDALTVLSYNTTQALGDAVPGDIYGVTHIIDGSIRESATRTRVSAAILDRTGQRQIWSERFDLSQESLLAGHDFIADRLLAVIAPDQSRPVGQWRGTLNSQAYDAYQKGRYAYFRYEPQAFVEALSHFAKAAELDPDFANAYAQQAYCRTTLYVFGLPGSDNTLDVAEGLAREAIRRDNNAALGYARLGWVLGYLGRPQETIAAFEAALARDPGNPECHLAYGETMNRLARPHDAGPLLEIVFSKDSFLPPSWEFPQGHHHLLLGEPEVAIRHFQSVLDRVRHFVPARVQMVRALWEVGDVDGAKRGVARINEIVPKYSLAHSKRMFPYPVQKEADALTAALSGAGLR